MTFKLVAVALDEIGSPTTDPGTQWAKMDLGFEVSGDTHRRWISITTKVPRLRETTMAEIATAAGDEAVALLEAALVGVKSAPFPDLLADQLRKDNQEDLFDTGEDYQIAKPINPNAI